MEAEEDNVHPVVRLLVARMESHPEEFDFDGHGYITNGVEGYDTQYRWEAVLARVKEWASGEDMAVLRKPYMDAIHRDALDELLNGPERRAEEQRKYQENLKHYSQQKAAGTQQYQYQNALSSSAYAAQMQNAYAQVGLRIEHDLASHQYRISNGTIGEVVDEEEIRKPGLLDRVLDWLIK